MTIRLTPEILRACYDFLSECQPFDRWNLPAGEDVIFKVVRNPQNFAMHSRVGNRHCIEVSTRYVGHIDTLVTTMAHEIVHVHEGKAGAARRSVMLGHLSSHPVILFTGYSDRLSHMQVLLSSHPMIIIGLSMPKNTFKNNPLTQEYEERSKNLLKAELKRRGIGYRELSEKLAAIGLQETERNLANKISRGGFTAAFFIECLSAIGCHTLRLEPE